MAGYGGRSYASSAHAGSGRSLLGDESPHYGGINFGDDDEWGGSGTPVLWRPIMALSSGITHFEQGVGTVVNPRLQLVSEWASILYEPEDDAFSRDDTLFVSLSESSSKMEAIAPESSDILDTYIDEDEAQIVTTDFEFPDDDDTLDVLLQETAQTLLLTPVDLSDDFDLQLSETSSISVVVVSDPDEPPAPHVGQGDILSVGVTERATAQNITGFTPIGWIGPGGPGGGSSGGGGGSTYTSPSYTVVVGDGETTEFVIEHGLPSTDLLVVVHDTQTGERINVSYEVLDDGRVIVYFADAPDTEGARITILAPSSVVGGGGGGGWDGGGGSPGALPGRTPFDQEGKDPRVRAFYESPKQMSMQELSETGLVYPVKLPYETELYEVDPWLEGRGGGDLCDFGWMYDRDVSPVGELNNGMVDDSAIVLRDGRVLYVYTDAGGRIMGGYVENSWKFMTDNFTTEDDFVIFDGLSINTSRGGTAPAATISKAGNPERLFLVTAWQETSDPIRFSTKVWTSVDEGRTWELRQELSWHDYEWEEGTTNQGQFTASNVTSTVATMPNGRLIVVGPWWVTMGLKAPGHVLGGQVWGVWTSDDNGNSWTWRTYWGHGPIVPLVGWIPLYVNTFSRSMAYLDGYMYCVTQSDWNSWHMHMWRSSDGISWGSPSDGTRTRGGFLYNLAAGWHTWSQPEATGFIYSGSNLALWHQGDCLYLFSSRHARGGSWHFDWETMRYTDPYTDQYGAHYSRDITKTGAILETIDPGDITAWKKVEEIHWENNPMLPHYRWPGLGPLRALSGRPIFQRLEKNFAMVGTNGRLLGIMLDMPGEYEGVIKPERIVYR